MSYVFVQPNCQNPSSHSILSPAKVGTNKWLQSLRVLTYCAQIKSFLNFECGTCGVKWAFKRQVSLEIKPKEGKG